MAYRERWLIGSAKEAIRKALELDETIGEAHDTLGVISWRFDWNWDACRTRVQSRHYVARVTVALTRDRAVFLSFLADAPKLWLR